MKIYAREVGEWASPLMVQINGVDYPTQLYNGVQRFVPEHDVEVLVRVMLEAFDNGKYNYYNLIPENLQRGTHRNPIVNWLVEANREGFASLNEVSVQFQLGRFTPHELIEFETLHGWSVDGFDSSVQQKLVNADYAVITEDDDGEIWEDVSEHYMLVNPLWENEAINDEWE